MHKLAIAGLFFIYACSGCQPNSGSSAPATPDPAAVLALNAPLAHFKEIAAAHGGKDITGGLQIEGRGGKHPVSGLAWDFPDYGCVLTVHFDDADNLSYLEYCTAADFSLPKLHRYNASIPISKIQFHDNGSTTTFIVPKHQ